MQALTGRPAQRCRPGGVGMVAATATRAAAHNTQPTGPEPVMTRTQTATPHRYCFHDLTGPWAVTGRGTRNSPGAASLRCLLHFGDGPLAAQKLLHVLQRLQLLLRGRELPRGQTAHSRIIQEATERQKAVPNRRAPSGKPPNRTHTTKTSATTLQTDRMGMFGQHVLSLIVRYT